MNDEIDFLHAEEHEGFKREIPYTFLKSLNFWNSGNMKTSKYEVKSFQVGLNQHSVETICNNTV